MSDEIKDLSRKGYCLMFAIIGALLFLALVLFIYYYNFDLTFDTK